MSPAGASGEYTTLTLTSPLTGTATTFQWTYDFVQGEASAATGSLEITFDQPFAVSGVGVEVRSHSGDAQDGDIVTIGAGPDSGCTPTTTVRPTTTTVAETTVPATTTTTARPVTTTTTVGSSSTTTVPAPVPTTPAVRVLGESASGPGDPGDPGGPIRAAGGGELAKTGAGSLGLLLGGGVALLLLGSVLTGIRPGRRAARPRRLTTPATVRRRPAAGRDQDARTAWAVASRAMGIRKGEHDT